MTEPAVHPIRVLGDPVLRATARPVEVFDASLRQLVTDMFASMYAADGVGLAANQIGVDLDVFVYDCPEDPDEEATVSGVPDHGRGVVVNGRLTATFGDSYADDEGCLSLPGFTWPTPRPEGAMVDGQDVDGSPVTVTGAGLLGRCLQHEIGHLQGLVYLDTLPQRVRAKALRRYLRHAAG